ncbi:Prim_Pol domain containing protein [uncultured Caudovirales phage]|uniref:Prim_Pol domain containing protein n=1 Tax=uncultured Caudovirales phage TaxID=2100421 RepID=A0A6J5MZ41_9CAUD|nr:Prim_Pol domain containing protein [uncultured Caudovirales phage]
MTTTTKLEAALTYASWGWHVLPLIPNDKRPASAHGVHDATIDPEQIKAWWAQNPSFNIGIAAGEKSGIVVFDIDPRNGGSESWDDFTAEHGAVPDGICQLTAGGGQHYIAQARENLKSCELRRGVDFLANGRYFVVTPSVVNDREYTWEASGDPTDGISPFAIPETWLAAMAVRKVIVTATDGELITGNRNAGLASMAGSMRRNGFSSSEIFAAISAANAERCDIPLPASDVKRIAESIARYAPEHDVGASAALGDAAAENLIREQLPHPLSTFVHYDLDNIPPTEYVLDGIMEAGVVLVVGSAASGKTTQLLPLLTRVTHLCDPDDPLKPLLRRKLIWVSEDPKQALRILRSMREAGHFGTHSAREVSEWIKVVAAARLAPEIVAQVAPFYETMAVDNISADGEVYRTNPVVVFDTNNSVFDLENESDNSEVGRAMAVLKQKFRGIPLVLVGHIAKALKRADVVDFSARGAGAWEADANQVMYMIKEDDGKRWLEIVSAKHRFFARADGILFGASINVIQTHDILGNKITETLIHGVPEIVEAGGKSEIAKVKEKNRKDADLAARQLLMKQKEEVVISALTLLNKTEYHTKSELAERIGGNKNQALEVIDAMVARGMINTIYTPFEAPIEKRPGRHDSGYVMPKTYKKESNGD